MLVRAVSSGVRSLIRVNSVTRLTSSPRPLPVQHRASFWKFSLFDEKKSDESKEGPTEDKEKEESLQISDSTEHEKSLADLPKVQFASVHNSFRFFKGAVSTLHQLGNRQKAVFVYQRPKNYEDLSKQDPFRYHFFDVGFLAERPAPLTPMSGSASQNVVENSKSTADTTVDPNESDHKSSDHTGPKLKSRRERSRGADNADAKQETWVMLQRVRIKPSNENPPNLSVVYYEPLEDVNPPTPDQEHDLINQLRDALKEFLPRLTGDKSLQLKIFMEPDNPLPFGEFVDRCLHFVPNASISDLQKVLEEVDLVKRAGLVETILRKEIAILDLARELEKEAEVKEAQEATETLNKQKHQIESELEKFSESSTTIKKLKARLEGKTVPQYALDHMKDEFERLKGMEPNSSHDHGPLVDYLTWLTSLPWGVYSTDHLDIKDAKKTLEEDHYGLDDVKERILEFIASATLTGSVQGKILCLTGPPGTGKTSIAKSIAKTLGRKFYRFSVGGMSDPSEIKGHRRTYVASKPGKLIYGLKMAQSSNPVFLIDEIDKIERDPSSALLEALDPEQNKNFLDHYIDIPYDLSQVLFICTSNDHHRISPPLLDRMEVIEISGYVGQEKIEIAKSCLIPEESKRIGVPEGRIQITDSGLEFLVKHYCPQPGVRTLKKHIQRIFARACLKEQMEVPGQTLVINEDNLAEFVDEPVPPSRRYYGNQLPVGVAVGLAKTNYGGSIQYVESVLWITGEKPDQDAEDDVAVEIAAAGKEEKKKRPVILGGKLKVTGQTGDVMKESTQIALTFAKNFLATHQPSNKFFSNNNAHLHFPEGAMPKDGPSAGVTIVTSLLSLALNKPLAREIAMTGEITLSGKVLPVGGIKEKAIAAKIQGINELILPKQNESEWGLEIPSFVKQGLTVHFVDTFSEMFEIVFGYHIHSIPLFDTKKMPGESFIIGLKKPDGDGRGPLPSSRV